MRKLLILALLCPYFSMCQPLPIDGIIINEASEPVAGATVTLKRTGQVTVSDNNGHFYFPAALVNDTLIISAVGYETQAAPNNERGEVTIILKSKTALMDEVIINTGYETIPKERATGSFTRIGEALYNQQFSTTVLSRLEGIANGLSVNRKISSGDQIMVRGLSTIQGPKDPLIVVDNFPYSGDIANINPNDVASITVLKDAAAASIWGTKAGNGVIVITTKKGNINQPMEVQFNSAVSIRKPQDLFYLQNMTTSDYIDVEQFLFSKGYRFADTASSARPPFSPVYELLFRLRRGEISEAEADEQLAAWRKVDNRNEFNRYFYQPEVNRQTYLSLRGGSPANAYFFSAGYDHNTSDLASTYRRLGLKSENTFKLGRSLQLSAGVLFNQTNLTSGRPEYGSITHAKGKLPPYVSLADEQGNPRPVMKSYRQTYLDTTGGGHLLDWNYYPLVDYQHNSVTTGTRDLVGNLGIRYTFHDWLTADVKYQYENQQRLIRTYNDEESYFTRDLINLYSQVNRSTGAVTYGIPYGAILDLFNNDIVAHNLRGQVNINKKWNAISLAALAGGELRSETSHNTIDRTYGYNSDILSTGSVNYATAQPTYIRGSLSFIPNPSGFALNVNRYVSAFANAAATVKEKYTFSISGRRDGSNLFGVNTNNRWTPLWSAGLAWHLSREPLYHLPLAPHLTVRASYGYSGNANPYVTGVTTLAYLWTSPYTQTPMAQIDRFANPDLRWERVATLNLGVDFKTTGNRITGSLEYYRKKGTDLFGTAPIDYTAGLGVQSLTKNVASMKAYGLDLQLQVQVMNKALSWSVDGIFNWYKDRVTEYFLASKQGRLFVGSGSSISGIEGKPVYSIFSYKWAGLNEAGDPQGYFDGHTSKDYTTLTGPLTTIDDLIYGGPVLPPYAGALGQNFSYKNVTLNVRLSYKFGYTFRRSGINYNALFSTGAGHEDYAYRWQKPGDEQLTSVPSMIYPAINNRDVFYNGSEILTEKGDHVRLQYVTLSYEFKRTGLQAGLERMQVYVNANDLGIIWRANKRHLDPDYPSSVIPPSRMIAFGFRTTF